MRRCVGFTFDGSSRNGDVGATPGEDAPRAPYKVSQILPGTEAEAKLQLGDEIVSIDGCPVECLRITVRLSL